MVKSLNSGASIRLAIDLLADNLTIRVCHLPLASNRVELQWLDVGRWWRISLMDQRPRSLNATGGKKRCDASGDELHDAPFRRSHRVISGWKHS